MAVYNYEYLKKLNINIKESNKINTNTYDYLDIEKEELKRINMYNIKMKNYLNNYINILDKNLTNENIIDTNEEKKAKNRR